jgi:pyruvate dehydrogenase E2 component (dihydrolipoamide acetyltransferase)
MHGGVPPLPAHADSSRLIRPQASTAEPRSGVPLLQSALEGALYSNLGAFGSVSPYSAGGHEHASAPASGTLDPPAPAAAPAPPPPSPAVPAFPPELWLPDEPAVAAAPVLPWPALLVPP